jgi:hypothetical protein
MKRSIFRAACAIGLCSTSALVAQSTLPGAPRGGSPEFESNARLNTLRAFAASSQRQMTMLNYLSGRPLSLSTQAVPAPPLAKDWWKNLAAQAPTDLRPDCPMTVTRPIEMNDSMPVSRAPARNSEPMPVAKPLCANSLGAKR